MEIPGYGNHGKPKAGFPVFRHSMEIPTGFPRYHGYDYD
jgi:hypothetical protein